LSPSDAATSAAKANVVPEALGQALSEALAAEALSGGSSLYGTRAEGSAVRDSVRPEDSIARGPLENMGFKPQFC